MNNHAVEIALIGGFLIVVALIVLACILAWLYQRVTELTYHNHVMQGEIFRLDEQLDQAIPYAEECGDGETGIIEELDPLDRDPDWWKKR